MNDWKSLKINKKINKSEEKINIKIRLINILTNTMSISKA